MKKILLSIAFALMGIASGFAAKAHTATHDHYPEWWQRIWPFAFMVMNTSAGTVPQMMYFSYRWVATIHVLHRWRKTERLKATPQLADNAGERGTVEEQVINNQNKEKFLNSLNAEPQALAKPIGKDSCTSLILVHRSFGHSGRISGCQIQDIRSRCHIYPLS